MTRAKAAGLVRIASALLIVRGLWGAILDVSQAFAGTESRPQREGVDTIQKRVVKEVWDIKIRTTPQV